MRRHGSRQVRHARAIIFSVPEEMRTPALLDKHAMLPAEMYPRDDAGDIIPGGFPNRWHRAVGVLRVRDGEMIRRMQAELKMEGEANR